MRSAEKDVCCACVRRKQCIELEQQFDFLKDLVAAVPDMQGEGEENHTEGGGEKVPRRYLCQSDTHTHTDTSACLPGDYKVIVGARKLHSASSYFKRVLCVASNYCVMLL